MKVAGYYNEHGLPTGFVRIVVSNPPKDNQHYVVSNDPTSTDLNLVPINDANVQAEFLPETNEIEYIHSDIPAAFMINDEVIYDSYSNLIATINSRLEKLDKFPIVKFSVVDSIYTDLMNFSVVQKAFVNAKLKIGEIFGEASAKSWQDNQVFLPAINGVIQRMYPNTLSIRSVTTKTDSGVDFLKVIIVEDDKKTYSKRAVDKYVADAVFRYKPDLAINCTYVPIEMRIEKISEPQIRNNMKTPKAFISYSWTNPEHESRVMKLASDLRSVGVDCILDKWHLNEGDDAYSFMERMVTDQAIDKVIIISDRGYADKANSRSGGVGAETQIITPELYGKSKQSKFAVVLFERDEQGKPYLPVFYKSRLYIDMSDQSQEVTAFEQLVRWVFNKPLNVPPPIGETPNYLEDSPTAPSKTAQSYSRSLDAIKNSKPHAIPATQEYFDLVNEHLEDYRINSDLDPIDNEIVKSIGKMLPLRNELLSVISTMMLYGSSVDYLDIIKSFLESIFDYTQKPKSVLVYREIDWDNYRFLAHELMLHIVALAIKNKKYEWAGRLINETYFLKDESGSQRRMRSVSAFRFYIRSIDEIRNKRLNLRRISVHADMLKERCAGATISFDQLMQADFSLFFARVIHEPRERLGWYPITGVFMDYGVSFELYKRASSKKYLANLHSVLSVSNPVQVQQALDYLYENQRRLPDGDFSKLEVYELGNFKNLGTLS